MSGGLEITGPLGLSWSPATLQLLALGALLAGLGLTLWRASQRLKEQPARRYAVWLFNLLAFTAIALLLAPPEQSGPAAGRAVLLTAGADPDSPLSNAPVFALPNAFGPGAAPATEVATLSLPGQLPLRKPELAQLEVRGHGLEAHELAQLPDSWQLIYEPLPLEGLAGTQWPRLLEAGEPLQLSGRLLLPAENQVAQLRLVDPGGLTVAEASARGGQGFRLEALPRAPGRTEYRLQARRNDQLLADEPVAVDVRANAGARLLVLQSAPSFDTRQLVNWAADRGQAALVLTRISRDRSLVQAFNAPAVAGNSLSPALLRAFDLMLIDGRRWVSLAPAERRMILDAVEQGLGLLLLADTALADWLAEPGEPGLAFRLMTPESSSNSAASGTGDTLAWPLWPGAAPTLPLPVTPLRLQGNGLRTLTRSEAGFLLDAWYPLGNGRVAISLLREQHRWGTAGDPAASQYWSWMLRSLARPLEQARWLPPDPAVLARPGQALPVCAAGDRVRAFRLQALDGGPSLEGTLFPHADGFPLSCGWVRPGSAGWYRLELLADGVPAPQGITHFRVYGAGEWETQRSARRQEATGARARISANSGQTGARGEQQAISPLWVWLLLVISASLLWLERRLYDLGAPLTD